MFIVRDTLTDESIFIGTSWADATAKSDANCGTDIEEWKFLNDNFKTVFWEFNGTKWNKLKEGVSHA